MHKQDACCCFPNYESNKIKEKDCTLLSLRNFIAKMRRTVVESRQQWRDWILCKKFMKWQNFSFISVVGENYINDAKDTKMKEFFDNFELWSYNNLGDDESEMIKIEI